MKNQLGFSGGRPISWIRLAALLVIIFVHSAVPWPAAATLLDPISLGEALDADLDWETHGTVPWFGQTMVTADGQDAACVRLLLYEDWASLAVTATGPGTLSFKWRFVAPAGDSGLVGFELYQNGQMVQGGMGPAYVRDWQHSIIDLRDGMQTIQWTFMPEHMDGEQAFYMDQVVVATPSHQTAPVIVTDPLNQTYPPGQCATFSAQALCYPLPNFQWLRNGAPIPGATNSELFLSDIRPSDYAGYAMIAANELGIVTSAVARLVQPAITLEQALNTPGLTWTTSDGCNRQDHSIPWLAQTEVTHDGQAAAQGRAFGCAPAAWLQTIVSGPGQVTFWWKTYTTPDWFEDGDFGFFIQDQDGRYEHYEALPGNADWQQATVAFGPGLKFLHWNCGGYCDGHDEWTTGWLDQVVITAPPAILGHPLSRTRFAGQTAEFSVTGNGVAVSYQWFFNGQPLLGATSPVLMLQNIQASNAGNYFVTLSNAYGVISSQEATLTVLPTRTGPGSIDFSFDPTGGGRHLALEGNNWNCAVYSIAVQPDGKPIIGGDFVSINKVPCMNLARLQADGSADPSFDMRWGADGTANTVLLQPDGKVLVAGLFTMINAVPRTGLARLNTDGSVDASFNPVIADSKEISVRPLLQPDGKILVGYGTFTNINGVPCQQLARLNADGTLDTTFVPDPMLSSLYSYVSPAALQPDGRILVLCSQSSGWQTFLLRLFPDGSCDSSFHPDLVDEDHFWGISALAVQPDGKILIAHGSEWWLARLNPDGTFDPTFPPNGASSSGTELSGYVTAMALQPDGQIVLGGSFEAVAGYGRIGLVRMTSDGNVDETFDPGSTAQPSNPYVQPNIRAVAIGVEGHVLVAGQAAAKDGPALGFFRLEPNGVRDEGLITALTPAYATATVLVPLPDGKILVSGDFSAVSGVECQGFARINPDGSFDDTFQLGALASTRLRFLARQPDGKLLVTSMLEYYEGEQLESCCLLRLNSDGSLDETFQPVDARDYYGWYNRSFNSAALQSDGKIVIGGSFYHLNGVECPYIARLNSDGTIDPSFVPARLEVGDDWYITSVGIQSNGKIIVAGHIFDQPWETYYGLARLNSDGSLDSPFRARVRVNGPVFRMLIQPDDKIVFTGYFDLVNGVSRPGLARLDAEGFLDAGFNPPGGSFNSLAYSSQALALAPDSKIVVATEKQVLRLNPDGTLDRSWPTQVERGGWCCGLVSALAVQPDGRVLLSGQFASVNGVPARSLVLLQGDVMAVRPEVATEPCSLRRPRAKPPRYQCRPAERYRLVTSGTITGRRLSAGRMHSFLWLIPTPATQEAIMLSFQTQPGPPPAPRPRSPSSLLRRERAQSI